MGYPTTPFSDQPETLFKRYTYRENVGWRNWKAYHYGELPLPGRTYSAFNPPKSYPDPEAAIALRTIL